MGKRKNKRLPADATATQEMNKKIKKEEDTPNQQTAVVDDDNRVVENATKGNGGQQSVENPSNGNGNRNGLSAVDGDKGEKDESPENEGDEKAVVQGGEEASAEYNRLRIWVKNVPADAKDDDLIDFFKGCGTVTKVHMPIFRRSKKFRGFAFVEFEREQAVESALALNGMKMGDRSLGIERSKRKQRKFESKIKGPTTKVDGCLSVYITNLPWDAGEDDIRQFFKDSKVGVVTLAKYKESGNSRGFGHVLFEDDESLENAMKKHQTKFHGRPIRVYYSVMENDEIRKKFGAQKEV